MFAPLEQTRPQPGQARLVEGLLRARRGEAVEDRPALPVAARCHVVDRLEIRRLGAEDVVDFGFVPDVETALLAFRVGVEGAGEGALAGAHLAQHPAGGLRRPRGEERLARVLPDVAQEVEELGVVVQHLLEMRRQPALVGGIAGEAAAQMVVDAALGHALHGQHHGRLHQQGAGAAVVAPEQLQHPALGKLGSAADTAVAAVHLAQERPRHGFHAFTGDRRARLAPSEAT